MTAEHLKQWHEEHPEGAPHGAPRNPYQKFRDKPTPHKAIGAQCMRCMGTDDPDKPSPGYRTDIANCTDTRCPLYDWRPYKK